MKTSGKALASLVLGLVSTVGTILTGVPAIILGVLALGDIRAQHDQLRGTGLAIAGIVSGGVFGLTCGAFQMLMLSKPILAYVAEARNTTILASGSQWNWFHPIDGIDPAETDEDFHSTFFREGYDDGYWQTGEDSAGRDGGFGYGDDVDVDIGTPPDDRRHTAYFRCRFETQTGFDHLRIRLQRDDGVIIYLNGVEVGRDNVAAETEAYRLPAASTVSSGDETARHTIALSGAITKGSHLLAISLHNREGNSSDLRIAEITLLGWQNE